ncbi:MAG: hypothetical protein CK547_06945 [Chitinophagaceae bacterium]|nr:MAG: hypothetical protein CK547_06945 [Chitinophagaceae bacterium]
MGLFNSSNPTLSEKSFNRSMAMAGAQTMTVKGTLNRFGFLFLMVMATSFYVWNEASVGNNVQGYIIGGAIGGLVLALVLIFKQQWAQYLAPAYALLEGLLVGGISAVYNNAFAKIAPSIVMQAVTLTFGTAIAVYFLYKFGFIRATDRFRSILFTAMGGIMVFYLITFVLSLFNVDIPMLHQGSLMSIGISLVIVVIAALSLVLDFDRIEEGAAMGAPKYMEWFCAFGLLVTLVWLYVEILRLLGNIYGRRN